MSDLDSEEVFSPTISEPESQEDSDLSEENEIIGELTRFERNDLLKARKIQDQILKESRRQTRSQAVPVVDYQQKENCSDSKQQDEDSVLKGNNSKLKQEFTPLNPESTAIADKEAYSPPNAFIHSHVDSHLEQSTAKELPQPHQSFSDRQNANLIRSIPSLCKDLKEERRTE
jgi:hypothetical protein